MSQELIEQNENGDNSSVSLGNGHIVSMQVVQDIYNEITGKTEKLSKSYRTDHRTKFEDIEQLNIKIHQLYEQYNIVENNCNVTLYHIDDCKEVYSSFERFKLYDRSSTSPIENIRLQYNFLILLPKTRRPQSYTIEINIHSRAAIKQKAEKEHALPRSIIQFFATRTAQIEIEYIDYTVARNFQTTIDHWFSSLEQSKSSRVLKLAQGHTQNFSFILRYLSALFLCSFFFIEFPSWISTELTIETQLKLAILCFGTVYILCGTAAKIGTFLEAAVDRIQPLSYLKLNRGDDTSISELQKSNDKNNAKTFIGLAVAIGINLFSAWVAAKFGIGI